MLTFILRRLLLLPITLFGSTLLFFALLQLLSPVERAALYVHELPRNQDMLAAVIQRYGFDDPLPLQYWHWLVGMRDPQTGEQIGGLLRGDLGYSRTLSQPVTALIARRFPATLELAFYALWPILALGIWLGVVAAAYHNRVIDQLLRLFTIVGASMPTFALGLILLMVLYAQTGWFPPGRLSAWATEVVNSPSFHSYTGLMTVDALLNWRGDIFSDALRHLCLPVLTLSYSSLAVFVRVTRASMLETLSQDYIITARAKGLGGHAILYRHALRNALIPITTLSTLTMTSLLGGVVFIETIFDYPGIGLAAGQAAANLDAITTLGLTLLGTILLVIANLLTDVLYTVLDRRIRLG